MNARNGQCLLPQRSILSYSAAYPSLRVKVCVARPTKPTRRYRAQRRASRLRRCRERQQRGCRGTFAADARDHSPTAAPCRALPPVDDSADAAPSAGRPALAPRLFAYTDSSGPDHGPRDHPPRRSSPSRGTNGRPPGAARRRSARRPGAARREHAPIGTVGPGCPGSVGPPWPCPS